MIPLARRLGAFRTVRLRLALNKNAESQLDDVGEYARIGFGQWEGIFMGVPLLPEQILSDQNRALAYMERAVQNAAPIEFIGLGGVLSVVAGRGTALQAACGLPVTTGNAATAWAASRLCIQVSEGRPVAVLGGKGTVGKAVAEVLKRQGIEVGIDPDDLSRYAVVAGCHTTGGVLEPTRLKAGTTLIDVALPRSLTGPAPAGVRVLKGESLALPPGWRRDSWGHILHRVAGYGSTSVYACVIEAMMALATGRQHPWQQGKRLDADTVFEFGNIAEKLGFYPEQTPLKEIPAWTRRLLIA
jgi:predicted amino acid dehydrogenase